MTDPHDATLADTGQASGPVRVAAALVLGAWMAAAAQVFTPDLPQPGLDASWEAVMGEAADRGLHWGSDLAFTYGPASPLATHYGNAAYLPLTLPLLLLALGLYAACTLRLVTGGAGRVALAVLALGLVVAQAGGSSDATLLTMPLLPALLVVWRPRAGAGTALLAAATALVLGVFGMTKMSFPATALPLMLVADATLAARRRLPLLTLPFLAGFVAGDLAYGQSLSDLPLYLRMQGEVVAGYSEAMALVGGRREVAAVLLAGAGLWLVAVLSGRPGARWTARIPVAACLAWTLFMLFKAGFVRQDLHTLITWNGFALVAAVLALSAGWRPALARAALAAAVGAAVLVNVGAAMPAGSRVARFRAALEFEHDLFVVRPLAQATAAVALLRDPAAARDGLRQDRAEAWRAVAEAEPLPDLAGGVDIVPSRQNAVVAAGLDYRPRPSFQEYSTYTEGLAAANRAFLHGPRAPAWVLVGREPGTQSLTIDDRYPNFAEGALWPDLLGLYRPEQTIGDLVALHRRATPADLHPGPVRRSTAQLGTEIPVPGEDPVVFATLDVRPTLLGRLAGLVFRSPPMTLTVALADGSRQSYRFLPGIARSGFVLSPLVTDAAGFAALAEAVPPPPARRVVGVTVAGSAAFVSPEVAFTLQPLAPSPPPAARAAP